MPIYEYECKTCGNRFELRRGMKENDSDVKCPACGADGPRRVLSTFATGIGGSCAPGAST